MPLQEMFEDRYIPEPNSGCWIWLGYGDKNGYGTFYPRGERWKAHRYSWTIHNGPIPDGLMVCHRCDVPACVNPTHLFLGTQQDNISDCILKNRRGGIKLTEEQVLEIRKIYTRKHGEKTRLSEQYGISNQQICDILNNKYWKHLI